MVGPVCPRVDVARSLDRARRVRDLGEARGNETVDTERHLAALLIQSDQEALGDLRRLVLEPLAGLKPGSAERLRLTLRSWLLYQGRRGEVAADLFVHPQTVRYRMAQIRELFGDRLQDPTEIRDLVIALDESGPH
ncbi:MAG: helix-turn-helix domain-containing protein [Solirubrobacterales bacterium]